MEPTLRISHEERPLDLPSEFRAIVAAFVGGMRYGVKIRLPHAFLMTLLFRKGISSKEKLRIILRLVGEHSSKLAYFAALYKVRLPIIFLLFALPCTFIVLFLLQASSQS